MYKYRFLKYLDTINRTELGLDSRTSSPTEQTASSVQSLRYTRICHLLRNPKVLLCDFCFSHSGVVEDSAVMGCYSVPTGQLLRTFRCIIVPEMERSNSRKEDSSSLLDNQDFGTIIFRNIS
jgi:hypothetical protein